MDHRQPPPALSYFEQQLVGALVDLEVAVAGLGLELERIAESLETSKTLLEQKSSVRGEEEEEEKR